MPLSGERKREYNREWMRRRREQWFNGKVCAECGSDQELELDHVDPLTKVTHRVWSWSLERREAELVKCQVLCRPCHEAKSIAQQPITHGWRPYRHGTENMYQRYGCRCGLCKLAMKRKNALRYKRR